MNFEYYYTDHNGDLDPVKVLYLLMGGCLLALVLLNILGLADLFGAVVILTLVIFAVVYGLFLR